MQEPCSADSSSSRVGGNAEISCVGSFWMNPTVSVTRKPSVDPCVLTRRVSGSRWANSASAREQIDAESRAQTATTYPRLCSPPERSPDAVAPRRRRCRARWRRTSLILPLEPRERRPISRRSVQAGLTGTARSDSRLPCVRGVATACRNRGSHGIVLRELEPAAPPHAVRAPPRKDVR